MIDAVEIYSQNDLERKCRNHGFGDAVLVSIGNPHRLFRRTTEEEAMPAVFRARFRRVLRLEFFDLPSVDLVRPGKPKRIPRMRDLQAVVRFYQKHRAAYRRVVVHCWAGVSRSAAMGLLLLYLVHRDEDAALEELKRLRPYALPHEGILSMIDQLYGTSFFPRRMEILRCWKERIQKDLRQAETGMEELEAEE